MAAAGPAAGEFILLGRVTKPHGIRGELKIHPDSGQPENFLAYRRVYLGRQGEGKRIPYEIEQARVQGRAVVLQVAGCADRTGAEALVGSEVWLPREDLPPLEDREYYWADLVGRPVVTEDGIPLGSITGIMNTGAHDILSVTGKGGEHLIPVRDEFIVSVDSDVIVLRLPPGLLDMNRS